MLTRLIPLHDHRRPMPAAGFAAVMMLAGCLGGTVPQVDPPQPAVQPTVQTDPPPRRSQAAIRQARAEAARAANLAADRSQPSPQARNIAAYLSGVEADLLRRGLLRRDRTPFDAPVSADSLARNFIQIALRDEYSRTGTRLVADAHAAPLRRWSGPVRIQLEFGPGTDLASQRRDRAEIAAYASRLARVTGHPISISADAGNFIVMILTEDERRAIGPRLAMLVPGIPQGDIAAIQDLSPRNYCTVFAYSRGNSASYVRAVALIRAELPPRLRSSCIHEELAQGAGLANDSPEARPSIFNDDEEFALLTRHDELLLAMLYDRRLRPGMTEEQATPIIRTIATELVEGIGQ